MNSDQQSSRELLAMCLDEWGFPTEAINVRDGEDLESYECDLRLLQQLRVFGLLRYPNEAEAMRAAPEVIRIPATDGLDPITVYADDLGEGRGRLTVCCYSDSWSYTAAWGAMGGSLRSFIAGLNPHYLADNLLWPNAAKPRKHQRQYVERIAAVVIGAFAARFQEARDA